MSEKFRDTDDYREGIEYIEAMSYDEDTFYELKRLLKEYFDSQAFLNCEIEGMKSYIQKLETDIRGLNEDKERIVSKFLGAEQFASRGSEDVKSLQIMIAELNNENAKLKYKINKYQSDKKIKKIIDKKKLDQY